MSLQTLTKPDSVITTTQVPDFAPNLANLQSQQRLDSIGASWKTREMLTHCYNRVMEKKYAPLKAFEAFPVNSEGGWADELKYLSYDHSGEAAPVNCSSDFPSVNIHVQDWRSRVVTLGIKVEQCIIEDFQSRQVSFPLLETKFRHARKLLERLINRIAFYGLPEYRIMGIANNRFLPRQKSPITFGAETPIEQTLAAMFYSYSAGFVTTNMTESMPNAVIMPPSLYAYTSLTEANQYHERSILDKFRVYAANIQHVILAPEMENIGPDRTRGVFFYNRGPDSEMRMPHDIMMLDPFWDGMSHCTNLICRFAGLNFYYPWGAMLLYGF